jgi:hypothetical protein
MLASCRVGQAVRPIVDDERPALDPQCRVVGACRDDRRFDLEARGPKGLAVWFVIPALNGASLVALRSMSANVERA